MLMKIAKKDFLCLNTLVPFEPAVIIVCRANWLMKVISYSKKARLSFSDFSWFYENGLTSSERPDELLCFHHGWFSSGSNPSAAVVNSYSKFALVE